MSKTLTNSETDLVVDTATSVVDRTESSPLSRGVKIHIDSDVIENNPLNSKESGGREGPDPTRYGDWEKAGRCIDF